MRILDIFPLKGDLPASSHRLINAHEGNEKLCAIMGRITVKKLRNASPLAPGTFRFRQL
jgi:hypothetical protein